MPGKAAIKFDFVRIDDVKLHCATAGQGDELVLLLHGFPEFWYSWRHQLISLSDKFTVVAPDMRGYNLSDKPSKTSEYEIEKLVSDITGLIRHFGREKASIVGHDWGAAVAWATATLQPDYVSKLACLQVPPPSVWKKNQTFKQFLASWYMFFFQLPGLPEWLLTRNDYSKLAVGLKTSTAKKGVFSDRDIEEYKKAWSRPGALTAGINYYRANIIKRLFSNSGANPSDKIGIPTLFIYGEKDHAILPQTVEGVGNFVAGEYKELRIPDAGHWVQIEAKEEVTKALREFFED